VIGLRDVEVVAGGRAILALEALDVAEGETLAVLGANGAGKSTLLRVAGGLLRPDRGELLLDGRPASADAARRASAAVLQRPLLRRAATVRANVETGLRFAGVPRDERRRRAGEWMERLGLTGLAGRRAATLSGGEAQRVSLARALVLGPRLLLLDEPFSALDAPTRAELLADLRDLLEVTATATLFVTHDRHEAAAVADRVAILHAGALRQLGPPGAVLDHPADADCARLLGFENVLPAGLAGPGTVAVRAAALRLELGTAGVVERVLPFGERTRIAARIEGVRVLSDVAATTLRQGDRVDLRVDPADARPIRV
jgi:ABC-type sulfate/molybdate transport systems ATPase subunit